MRKNLENDIKKFGFTSAHQFGVLLLLSKTNLSQKQISDATLADESSTTRMLDRMIKKDIIDKKRSQDDKRKYTVNITKKGQKLLDKITPIVNKHNTIIENMITKDELKQLLNTLSKIDITIKLDK
jgi:DNA-binding MarR family transcriptional regulator